MNSDTFILGGTTSKYKSAGWWWWYIMSCQLQPLSDHVHQSLQLFHCFLPQHQRTAATENCMENTFWHDTEYYLHTTNHYTQPSGSPLKSKKLM